MTIYLIRHGETQWNRTHRLQEILDVALNCAGLRQARRLSARLPRLAIRSIYTSPLLSARHTALEIRGAQPWPVVVEDELREIDHRSWTGMTIAEIAEQHFEEHSVSKWRPERLRPRSGEPLETVYRRSTRVLCRVVMVGHGVVNARLLCSALAIPIARVWNFPQPNDSIYVLRSKGKEINSVECRAHD